MGDEEIIRKRLLIDGDGIGDDRRLNVLLRSFTKWCTSTSESPEEYRLQYERIMSQIAQCETAMTKSHIMSTMNAEELKHYESLYSNIESAIAQARKDIDAAKADLSEAKQVRRNRMEYDALAAIIATQPDRQDNSIRFAQLQAELGESEEQRRKLETKLEMRQKQCHLLLTAIAQLQELLDKDKDDFAVPEDEGDFSGLEEMETSTG